MTTPHLPQSPESGLADPIKRREALLLPLALFGLTSCATRGEEVPRSLAHVFIPGVSRVDVVEATRDVLQYEGYIRSLRSDGADMAYEKKGGPGKELLWGGMNSDGVWLRLKLWITSRGTQQLLYTNAYLVRNRNRATEDERKLSKLRAVFAQALLDEIREEALNRPQY